MAFFIIGIIFVVASFIVFLVRGSMEDLSKIEDKYDRKEAKERNTIVKLKTAISAGLLCVGILCGLISMIRTVPTGNTGIVTTFGQVENYTFDSGMHFTAPWHKVICMDNRTQKQQIQMSCFSSDIQEVTLTYTINYQINKQYAQDIYRMIGTDYYNIIILPKTYEAVKAVVAKYNAESLVASRGNLSNEIEQTLVKSLSASNIELTSTSLEDLDFTDAFTNAVEAKQVAEQNKLRAKTEQEQAIIEAEAEAQKKVIAAQATADANLIAAQNDVEVQKLAADAAEYAGQKQAAVNERISASLTHELNQYYLIEAWKNGADMPDMILGDSSLTGMFQLK